MTRTGPPAYAWDWFARQRLLWREARSRLASASAPVAHRYEPLEAKGEVLATLRSDYARDDVVREVVNGVVADLTFLSRTGVPFAELGATNAPRGMRWWWTALTGEELDRPTRPRGSPPAPSTPAATVQLSIEDVHEGYGDGR